MIALSLPSVLRARVVLGATLCALATTTTTTTSCSPESAAPGVQGPTETDERGMALGASSAERFGGMPAPAPATASSAPAPSAQAPGAAADEGGYHYTLPAGWSEAPPKPMRDVYLFAPGGVECWLTRLGPGAGGLQANVDRWRDQLGLGPASAEELAALPWQNFLGGSAQLVDITSADGSQRLLVLAQFLPDRSMFLRMSGPTAAVASNRASFDAFAASLHDGSGHTHDAPSPDGDGKDDGEEEAPAPSATTGNAGRAGGLRWVAPQAWQPLAPDQFRLAYFQVAPDVQCWITTLAGDGGGVEANLSRWHSQFGRSAPSAAQIAALPTERVLGRDALWVDLLGEGAKDGMIGVLCSLPAQSVFVKIQGPSDAVRAHAVAFREFCATLATE